MATKAEIVAVLIKQTHEGKLQWTPITWGAPFNRRGWLVQSGDRKYVFRATPEPCLLITAHDTVLPDILVTPNDGPLRELAGVLVSMFGVGDSDDGTGHREDTDAPK